MLNLNRDGTSISGMRGAFVRAFRASRNLATRPDLTPSQRARAICNNAAADAGVISELALNGRNTEDSEAVYAETVVFYRWARAPWDRKTKVNGPFIEPDDYPEYS